MTEERQNNQPETEQTREEMMQEAEELRNKWLQEDKERELKMMPKAVRREMVKIYDAYPGHTKEVLAISGQLSTLRGKKWINQQKLSELVYDINSREPEKALRILDSLKKSKDKQEKTDLIAAAKVNIQELIQSMPEEEVEEGEEEQEEEQIEAETEEIPEETELTEEEAIEEEPALTLEQIQGDEDQLDIFLIYLDSKGKRDLAQRLTEGKLKKRDYKILEKYREEYTKIFRRAEKVRKNLTKKLELYKENQGIYSRSEELKKKSERQNIELLELIDDETKETEAYKALMMIIEKDGANEVQEAIFDALEETLIDDPEIFEELESALEELSAQEETFNRLDEELKNLAVESGVDPEELSKKLQSSDTEFIASNVRNLLNEGTKIWQKVLAGRKERKHETDRKVEKIMEKKQEIEEALQEIDSLSERISKTLFSLTRSDNVQGTFDEFEGIAKEDEWADKEGTIEYAEKKVEEGVLQKGEFSIEQVDGQERWVCTKGNKQYILASRLEVTPEAGLEVYFKPKTKKTKDKVRVEKENGYIVATLERPYPQEIREEQTLDAIDDLLEDNQRLLDRQYQPIDAMLEDEEYELLHQYLQRNIERFDGDKKVVLQQLLEKLEELEPSLRAEEEDETESEAEPIEEVGEYSFLQNMTRDELILFIKNNELNIKPKRSQTEKQIADKIENALDGLEEKGLELSQQRISSFEEVNGQFVATLHPRGVRYVLHPSEGELDPGVKYKFKPWIVKEDGKPIYTSGNESSRTKSIYVKIVKEHEGTPYEISQNKKDALLEAYPEYNAKVTIIVGKLEEAADNRWIRSNALNRILEAIKNKNLEEVQNIINADIRKGQDQKAKRELVNEIEGDIQDLIEQSIADTEAKREDIKTELTPELANIEWFQERHLNEVLDHMEEGKYQEAMDFIAKIAEMKIDRDDSLTDLELKREKRKVQTLFIKIGILATEEGISVEIPAEYKQNFHEPKVNIDYTMPAETLAKLKNKFDNEEVLERLKPLFEEAIKEGHLPLIKADSVLSLLLEGKHNEAISTLEEEIDGDIDTIAEYNINSIMDKIDVLFENYNARQDEIPAEIKNLLQQSNLSGGVVVNLEKSLNAKNYTGFRNAVEKIIADENLRKQIVEKLDELEQIAPATADEDTTKKKAAIWTPTEGRGEIKESAEIQKLKGEINDLVARFGPSHGVSQDVRDDITDALMKGYYSTARRITERVLKDEMKRNSPANTDKQERDFTELSNGINKIIRLAESGPEKLDDLSGKNIGELTREINDIMRYVEDGANKTRMVLSLNEMQFGRKSATEVKKQFVDEIRKTQNPNGRDMAYEEIERRLSKIAELKGENTAEEGTKAEAAETEEEYAERLARYKEELIEWLPKEIDYLVEEGWLDNTSERADTILEAFADEKYGEVIYELRKDFDSAKGEARGRLEGVIDRIIALDRENLQRYKTQ